ncbi:class I SAM-dependent methyltransferase [Massilia sp. PWRC2]|uniref:class I SAM-dependent methyltransferase n=1 Tax=Massilia sp. PWRC2 TaxID=2804626 RepID=UPI003CF530A2
MSLPEPAPDALAASHALLQRIADDIARAGGAISFARFMELALYTPGLGYYSGGAAKLGAAGDFTTAPELSPLFGATIARVASAIIAQSAPAILEFGAGTGKLAHDVLSALAADGIAVDQYLIVELSGELRQRQQQALRDFPQVRWLDALPVSFSGVVLANEVLDAMPVELVSKESAGWQQVTVTIEDGRLAWGRQAPDAALALQLARQIVDAATLDVGYLTEVHPLAVGFMASLARMLSNGGGGAALLFDYGFPAHEYYVDDRTGGTVMCHYRHHAHTDPFYVPGLQDITAHVDFTAMALAAQEGGLEVLAYMSQAGFLLAGGITELLLRTDPADAARYLPQANAVQKLLSPAEMGELFKVLVVGHGVTLGPAIASADRSHRL